MFDPSDTPRVFALPPGVDFPSALIDGLLNRLTGHPPEALATVELFVNTRRMQRRLRALFDTGTARLLPRIRLITDLGSDIPVPGLPPAVPALRRRLQLSQLVARLLDKEPDLAPRASIFDLADSLARLMDEMHGEGVMPQAIHDLDVEDLSGHWARSRRFLSIVERFFGPDSNAQPDAETRQRLVVEHLVARWQENPPAHPVIVAGSTGSRGTTAAFMQAVASLPQGALVFPGFDTDLPENVWTSLSDTMTGEDHPQFRFARLLQAVQVAPEDVAPWADALPPNPARNRLVSLALRPAPVTDQWLNESAAFSTEDVAMAAGDITLIEAPSPRAEAVSIALRLRQAVEEGENAALITPDRMLTRQVTAALGRWGIEPDDSAGIPLTQTAPGRFLRHVADLFGNALTAPALLTLLKHPLCNTGTGDRGDHLRFTRDLELELLRGGPRFPDAHDLTAWAAVRSGDPARHAWADWLSTTLLGQETAANRPLSAHVSQHIELAETLAAGPEGNPAGTLWDKAAGREALQIVETLQREAEHGGEMTAPDYRDMFRAVLETGVVRDQDSPHRGVRILGTLEARVHGAGLVILAGLNDGIWPDFPAPDPWLNRQMRARLGLLLPERHIGLSAHDFQQAIGASRVVLSRAVRDAEAETVPSRWLNRLLNLMLGMSSAAETEVDAMRARGRTWLDLASRLDDLPSVPAVRRPSPCPPVAARPKRLSVTQIAKLVRDPYAIYAKKILRLEPLAPLSPSPDAPLRGTILHSILEKFIRNRADETVAQARQRLMSTAADIMQTQAPWPATRALWLAKLDRVADRFLKEEAGRMQDGENIGTEMRGRIGFQDPQFTLTATADRIDRRNDNTLAIFDYKSGSAPAKKDQARFDKQLLLEAVIAQSGGFENLAKTPVTRLGYIEFAMSGKFDPDSPESVEIDQVKKDLSTLIAAYENPVQGYTAQRIQGARVFTGDYDHLSRFGEWSLADMPRPEKVGS